MPHDLPALEDVAQRSIGLAPDDLRLLPDRLAVAALELVAREAGPEEALRLLDHILRDGPGSATLANERIRLLLEAGRLDEAIAAARERLAQKETLTVQSYLARALLNKGAVEEADEVARAMLAREPDKVTALYVAGLAALARKRPDEARTHFERLVELHPDSPSGPRGLARVALLDGDAAGALDLILQALDCYRNSPPSDLLRELALYAGRVPSDPRAAIAHRSADETIATRDEELRARLREEAAQAREGGKPARPARASRRTGIDDEEMEADEETLPELPPAPPPDPVRHDQLVAALREHFGHDTFRPGQEEVLSAVLGGYDTLAVMPTGAGKSLCYQLPAAMHDGVTLVISPLIALMKDQVDALPPALLAATTLINSTLESAELTLRLADIAAGRYRLVYAAPERLRQRPFIHALRRAGVRLIVIDEAHCLSMWGHDFRPDYLFIRSVLPELGDPQVLAMTATATREMLSDMARQLGRAPCVVNTGVLRDNLYLIAARVDGEDHKMRILLPFLHHQRGCGIVYVHSREAADRLERVLRQEGINARAYHAGMGGAERTALQDRFMSGEVRVMVATVAFGMGVDKADVRFIVHYHPPRSLEAYSQESGRAGRDGKPAVCLLLHSRADRANLTRWSNEQAVDVEGLRAVYRALRQLLREGEGLVDAAAMRERLEPDGYGEIDLRVAISLLESAGLVRRGPDIPRGATVTLRDNTLDDEMWRAFVRAAHLELRRPVPIDLVSVARTLHLDVAVLEDRLLAWQDEERLSYRGVGRDMLIAMLPPPPDTAERMAALLEGIGRRNRRRLRTLFAYLDTDRCRHAFIARYFGHEAGERCRRCDVCRPVTLEEIEPVAAERLDDPVEAVRLLVEQHPLGYGKTGVIDVLKGATARRQHAGRTELFGALAHLPKSAIARAVDHLLAEGTIALDTHNGYTVLRPARTE